MPKYVDPGELGAVMPLAQFASFLAIPAAAFCALVAAASWAFGRRIIAMLPGGELYMSYWWAVPWLTAITAIGSVAGFYTTAEVAAGRFGFLRWMLPIDLLYPAVLLLVTGCGYFTEWLPAPAASFLNAHNVRSLDTMLWWMTAVNVVKCFCCISLGGICFRK